MQLPKGAEVEGREVSRFARPTWQRASRSSSCAGEMWMAWRNVCNINMCVFTCHNMTKSVLRQKLKVMQQISPHVTILWKVILVIFDLLIKTLRQLLHTQTTQQNNRDGFRAHHSELWASPSPSTRSFCLIGCIFSPLGLRKVHFVSIPLFLLAATRYPSYPPVSPAVVLMLTDVWKHQITLILHLDETDGNKTIVTALWVSFYDDLLTLKVPVWRTHQLWCCITEPVDMTIKIWLLSNFWTYQFIKNVHLNRIKLYHL